MVRHVFVERARRRLARHAVDEQADDRRPAEDREKRYEQAPGAGA